MLITTRKVKTKHTRLSKNKKSHTYTRYKIVAVFECDSCKSLFERDQGSMDKKRISGNFLHVCSNCNQKQFAQQAGVKSRKFWNIPADSDTDITKL